jgi:NAD(P)-dependent dehydrogenase (short-subunit alcohol dehydrogenase family)
MAMTEIVPICMDLSKPETIVECAKIAQDVDIVVNNAAVLMNNSNPLDPVAIANLDLEMKVNVHGLLHVAQAFAPILIQRGGQDGTSYFVQINSVGSLRSAAPHVSTYSASKAASYSLTQSLRMSFKNRGVTVLSVHPGPIATDMIAAAGLGSSKPEAPTQVADAIVEAIQSDDDDVFHIYPDSKSQALGRVYQNFAKTVIEPCVPYPE